MAYGAGAAGAAGAGYMYQICDKLTEAVVTFVNSIHFNKEEVKEETKRSQLNLTQAYALLWQESKDGEVDGAWALPVVPHFLSPCRVSPFSHVVIFTHARILLALLSLRENGGVLVV